MMTIFFYGLRNFGQLSTSGIHLLEGPVLNKLAFISNVRLLGDVFYIWGFVYKLYMIRSIQPAMLSIDLFSRSLVVCSEAVL